MSLSSYKMVGFAVALASMTAVGGCDDKQEAEPMSASKDRPGAAFEEKLKGCAAVAEDLGRKWTGEPYADLKSVLETSLPLGVSTVRVIRPNTPVTRDYRIDRLNVTLDDKDVVTKFYCG